MCIPNCRILSPSVSDLLRVKVWAKTRSRVQTHFSQKQRMRIGANSEGNPVDHSGTYIRDPRFLAPIGTLYWLRPREWSKRVWRPLAEKVFTGASGASNPSIRVPGPIYPESRTAVAPRVTEIWPPENLDEFRPYDP